MNFEEQKNIEKLQIGNQHFFRVSHFLGEMMTGISMYKLARTPLTKEDYTLTELTPHDVTKEMLHTLLTNEQNAEIKEEEVDMLTQAFEMKYNYLKSIVEKEINIGTQRRLLQFYEVSGLHFGYVYENNMPYTKLYQMSVDVDKNEVHSGPVPPDFLPALLELLTPIIFHNQESLIIQVDEGTYVRVSKEAPNKGLVVVVVAEEGETKEESIMKVVMSYLLESENGINWMTKAFKDGKEEQYIEAIDKSLTYVHNDLILMMYKHQGESALEFYEEK